jgi:hypothetical protein
VIDLPRLAAGARRQRWFGGFATRKQAQTALSAALGEIGKGSYVEPSAMTVSGFLQRWLQDYVQHNCAAKTGERNAEIVRNHVLPAIGHVRLRELKPAHIQEMYSHAKRAGRMVLSNGRTHFLRTSRRSSGGIQNCRRCDSMT